MFHADIFCDGGSTAFPTGPVLFVTGLAGGDVLAGDYGYRILQLSAKHQIVWRHHLNQ